MQVTVRYLSIIREITGTREEKVNVQKGSTINEILRLLVQRHGSDFERMVRSGRDLRGLQIIYFMNGQNIATLKGLETLVTGDSEIVLIPPVAGGRGCYRSIPGSS